MATATEKTETPRAPGPHNDPALADRGRKEERDAAKAERAELHEKLQKADAALQETTQKLNELNKQLEATTTAYAAMTKLANDALLDISDGARNALAGDVEHPDATIDRFGERAQAALDDIAKRGAGLDDDGG